MRKRSFPWFFYEFGTLTGSQNKALDNVKSKGTKSASVTPSRASSVASNASASASKKGKGKKK